MIRIAVIDDEPIIAKGIKAILSQYVEYEVVGTASDGQAGRELIIQTLPEIVLTDIEMPKMDGIELVASLKKENIHCQFIFISAYRDFKYAQSAIKLGVTNYIVKPIDEKELIQSLKQAEIKLKKQLNLDFYLLEEQLNGFFKGNKLPHIKQLSERYREIGFAVVFIQHQDTSTLASALSSTWFSEFNDFRKTIFFNEKEHSVFCYLEEPNTVALAKKIQQKKELFKDFFFISSKTFTNLNDIYFAIGDVQRQRKLIFFVNIDLQEMHKNAGEQLNELLNLIEGNFSFKVFSQKLLALLGQYAFEENRDIDVFIQTSSKGIEKIMEKFAELFPSLNLSPEKISRFILEITLSQTFTIMNSKITDIFSELFVLLEKIGTKNLPEEIHTIIHYVKQNFRRDISLSELADLIHMNRTYVSTYFKRHTGESFKTFQTRLRMSEAKSLLINTDKKIYEISDEIGYVGTHHFNNVFTNFFDKTPSQYRSDYHHNKNNLYKT